MVEVFYRPTCDDDDEDEPLGTEPEGGEDDGTYPNPPTPTPSQ